MVFTMMLSSEAAGQTTASVTVIAVTPFGEILRPVRVTEFASDLGSGHDFSSRFAGAEAIGIPYGAYLARVIAGGRVIASRVHVNRRNTLLVLSGPGEIIERGAGLPVVVGEVLGPRENKPVWVRLVRTFSEDLCCTIVPLSADGTFAFGGMDAADYILLVLTDGRVLFEGTVRIESPDARITVDLAKGTATVEARRK
jgi:hypothetical protein